MLEQMRHAVVGKINVQHTIPVLRQYGADFPDKAALRIRNDHAVIALQQVRLDVAARFARAAGADDQIVVVDAGNPGIVAAFLPFGQKADAVFSHGVCLLSFVQIVWIIRSARPKSTAS